MEEEFDDEDEIRKYFYSFLIVELNIINNRLIKSYQYAATGVNHI